MVLVLFQVIAVLVSSLLAMSAKRKIALVTCWLGSKRFLSSPPLFTFSLRFSLAYSRCICSIVFSVCRAVLPRNRENGSVRERLFVFAVDFLFPYNFPFFFLFL
jgi:hypothetical protein